jgi:biopolymer transport protein ExbD
MAIGFAADEDEDQPIAAINTTPLVDVMLVLLIIFLITIPVAIQSVPLQLPQAVSQLNQTPPGTVILSLDREGRMFWNGQLLAGEVDLDVRLHEVAGQMPQPELQLRGDRQGRFGPVGRLVEACRKAGILKLGFVTEPEGGS